MRRGAVGRSIATSQQSLVSLASTAFASRPVNHARVALESANRELGGVMRDAPMNAPTLLLPDLFESRPDLVGATGPHTHGEATTGRERSSYGRNTQSKNAHVRFHESICAGESTRSNV